MTQGKFEFWSATRKGLWKHEVMTKEEWDAYGKISSNDKDRTIWVYEDTCVVNGGTKFALTGIIRGMDMQPQTYIADSLDWFERNLELDEWIFYIRDCETGEKIYYIPVREKDYNSNPRIYFNRAFYVKDIKEAREKVSKQLNQYWEIA